MFFQNNLINFFRVSTEVLRHGDDFSLEIDVFYFDVFRFRDGFEDEVHLDVFFSRFGIAFFQLVHILVHIFEIVVEVHALRFELNRQFFDHLIDFVVDHDLRDIYFSVVDDGLQDFGIEFFQSLVGCLRFKAFADVGFEVVDTFKFAGFFGKFVIDGREFAAFYVVDFNGEDGFFTSQGFFKVIFREGNFDVFFIAGFAADELIFKARNEAAGADLERIGLAFAAFECDAVDGAFEVDDSKVIFCDFRAFRSYDQFSVLFLEVSQFFGNVFVAYFCFIFGNCNALYSPSLTSGFLVTVASKTTSFPFSSEITFNSGSVTGTMPS